jgi:spore coat protein CotF
MPNNTSTPKNAALDDKQLLKESLISQKHITSSYNTYAGECVSVPLRKSMLNILTEEHEIQANIFEDLQTRGWYQVEAAPQQKIDQTKQKLQSS